MEDLKYPIGKFSFSTEVNSAQIPSLINSLEQLPGLLAKSVEDLSEEILDSPYRPEGWTIRQVVHHIADSHMNGYIRFKLALTEDGPTIKPYEEAPWAELDDAAHMPVDVSLKLINALHQRWVHMVRSLNDVQLDSVYLHPVNGKVSLKKALHLYAWHGSHHLAHITAYRKRVGL